MAEKKIKTRIQNKHDLEANWLNATFVPLQGELIVYDVEIDSNGNTLSLPEGRTTPYTHERFKIGDGIKTVTELPFFATKGIYSGNDLRERANGINSSNKIQLYGPRVEQYWKADDIYIDTGFNAIFKCIVCGFGADGNDYWYAEWEKLGDISSTHDASMITGLADVATSGNYNDLTGKPTIPVVNNATLTIQKNGETVKTFTANSANDVTANITVPTTASEVGAVPTTRTVNKKALSADITLNASDVGADPSGSAGTALADAKSYTDTKISDLINSAPSTLDTLGEIADAMQENMDVVDALDQAIGSKVDKTTRVNGYELSGNVFLSKSDISLGNVDNTADADKSVASAAKLTTARAIDGVSFDGTADISHFGICETAAGTAAKTVAITGFTLKRGARAVVKFINTNSAAGPTLNVNSTGTYPIIYKSASIAAYPVFGVGSLEAMKTYEFVFTGANYELVGSLHNDRLAGTLPGYAKTGGDITWTGGVGTVPALDNKPDVYVSETTPQTTKVGSIWFDTSVVSTVQAEEAEF